MTIAALAALRLVQFLHNHQVTLFVAGYHHLGNVQAVGLKNTIAGSGSIELAALICKNVKNEIAGSGDIMLSCLNVDQVSTSIAGSGDVILRGNVGTHTEDIAGSGKVDVSGIKK